MKKNIFEYKGIVIESLPNTTFRIKLIKNNHIIIAHLSGKMRKNYIKILVGDSVMVEISKYDINNGRITYRYD